MELKGTILQVFYIFLTFYNRTSAKLILGLVSIIFDVIFMMQHYVWYREPVHQRVVVQVGKNSELASPHPSGSGKSSPFKIEIGPNELEAQRNTVESTVKSP